MVTKMSTQRFQNIKKTLIFVKIAFWFIVQFSRIFSVCLSKQKKLIGIEYYMELFVIQDIIMFVKVLLTTIYSVLHNTCRVFNRLLDCSTEYTIWSTRYHIRFKLRSCDYSDMTSIK